MIIISVIIIIISSSSSSSMIMIIIIISSSSSSSSMIMMIIMIMIMIDSALATCDFPRGRTTMFMGGDWRAVCETTLFVNGSVVPSGRFASHEARGPFGAISEPAERVVSPRCKKMSRTLF